MRSLRPSVRHKPPLAWVVPLGEPLEVAKEGIYYLLVLKKKLQQIFILA